MRIEFGILNDATEMGEGVRTLVQNLGGSLVQLKVQDIGEYASLASLSAIHHKNLIGERGSLSVLYRLFADRIWMFQQNLQVTYMNVANVDASTAARFLGLPDAPLPEVSREGRLADPVDPRAFEDATSRIAGTIGGFLGSEGIDRADFQALPTDVAIRYALAVRPDGIMEYRERWADANSGFAEIASRLHRLGDLVAEAWSGDVGLAARDAAHKLRGQADEFHLTSRKIADNLDEFKEGLLEMKSRVTEFASGQHAASAPDDVLTRGMFLQMMAQTYTPAVDAGVRAGTLQPDTDMWRNPTFLRFDVPRSDPIELPKSSELPLGSATGEEGHASLDGIGEPSGPPGGTPRESAPATAVTPAPPVPAATTPSWNTPSGSPMVSGPYPAPGVAEGALRGASTPSLGGLTASPLLPIAPASPFGSVQGIGSSNARALGDAAVASPGSGRTAAPGVSPFVAPGNTGTKPGRGVLGDAGGNTGRANTPMGILPAGAATGPAQPPNSQPSRKHATTKNRTRIIGEIPRVPPPVIH